MKKALSLILILCIIVLFCLSSCAKKDKNDIASVSSDVSYKESSSGISKTEDSGEFTFAFDPYVLPVEVKYALKDTTPYNKFVNAVLEAKESAPLPSREYYDIIRFAIGENFPFSALISNCRYDSVNNRVLISYEFSKTHSEKIGEFKKAVQEIFNTCVKNTDDDAIAAISLYSYLAKNIDIKADNTVIAKEPDDTASSEISSSEQYSTQNDNTEIKADIYSTLMDKKGTASSVSSLYNFLLMQLGIECKTVSSWNVNSYKTWNMIKLDSKWYHCDIASEQRETEGDGLKYFGMTEQKVTENTGLEDIYTGQSSWFTDKLPKSNSNRFKDFANIVSWEINTNRDGLVAYSDEFSRFSWNIKD